MDTTIRSRDTLGIQEGLMEKAAYPPYPLKALSDEKKLELTRSLNWDYEVSPQDILSIIEGKIEAKAPFDRKFLFARSLERLPWHYM